MRRRTLLAVIAVALLSLSGSFSHGSGGAAAGASGQTPESQASSDDGLLRDAQSYAKTYGVSVSEALRRLQLQDQIGTLNAELAAQEPNTFAGLWIEHRPVYRVIAAFTGDGASSLGRHARGAVASLVTARQAALTLRQLQALELTAVAEARAQGIAVEAAIDLNANRVETYVSNAADVSRLTVSSSVIVGKAGREEVRIYGGLSEATCTAGFSVQSASGLLGVTTAGHCDPDQTITDATGATYQLTSQAVSYGNGGYDWQWHALAGATVTNTIQDGAATTRSITGTLSWSAQSVGDFVCKFGKTTGYTCGNVTTKNWCFTQTDGTTGCNYIFAKSSNGTALSAPGDSGGPWFSGNTARGSHSLGYDTAGSAYTAIDYLSGGIVPAGIPGVTIMTSSPTATAPAAPTGLTASASGKGAIALSWTGSTGATSYNVKRSTASGGPYTTIATGVSTTTYKNSGLTAGVTYYYVVSAVNSAGESPNSSQASATAK